MASDSLDVSARSLVVRGLEEWVEYEIFVQPSYGGKVLGQPSSIAVVRTHQVRGAVDLASFLQMHSRERDVCLCRICRAG